MLDITSLPQLTAADMLQSTSCLKQTPFHRIACANWPEDFPEKPEAGFHIAYDGKDMLFILFIVEEEASLAEVYEDNGPVWTDSCVEFFINLDNKGYYNFEANCIGKLLLGYRKSRTEAEHAPKEILDSVIRLSSLGTENFSEKHLGHSWELTLAIPAKALFRHHIGNWKEITGNCNLYKCGDHLTKPHYLSWQPIKTARPDFHRPEFFSRMNFEK